MATTKPKTKREPKRVLHSCILCGWQEICTEAEVVKHIADKHEKYYVPRSKKKSGA